VKLLLSVKKFNKRKHFWLLTRNVSKFGFEKMAAKLTFWIENPQKLPKGTYAPNWVSESNRKLACH